MIYKHIFLDGIGVDRCYKTPVLDVLGNLQVNGAVKRFLGCESIVVERRGDPGFWEG